MRNQPTVYLVILVMLTSLKIKAQNRIITAGSSSSEIVCVLGFCDNIVATDRTSLYPEALQKLPSIGYRSGISAEGIISQRPDLVIFEREYVKDELINQLSATGIKIVVVNQNNNWEDSQKRIRAIAEALDKKQSGEELISSMEKKLDVVRRKVNEAKQHPTVLCVYARGPGSMQVAGGNTSFSLVEFAGAKNAIPEIDGYKPLNTESLIQANPDYILFFDSGLKALGGVDGVLNIPGVQQTTAGKKKQIIAMDGILLTNWGPRLAEAAKQLFNLTHPEVME